MDEQLLYQVALTITPQIGPVQARMLVEHFGDAKSVFTAGKKNLSQLPNMGEVRAKCIREFTDFKAAELELEFIEKYQIQTLWIQDHSYPKRLLNCYDAPILLYYKGKADLNAKHMVSIIGTRNQTDYGRQVTERIIQDLKEAAVTIISGLALGIDATAHKTALNQGLPTVAVLAHGLHTIYPSQHKGMAKEITVDGGLLTEFTSTDKPDKHNFPRRNRIVAGISDATIVIETAVKGGSMITAEIANTYNRDVFAVPGRITDQRSSGCNYLIQQNKAVLLTDGKALPETMGWIPKQKKAIQQRSLFPELSDDEKKIVLLLEEKEMVHIDEMFSKLALSGSSIAAAILNLELLGVVAGMPGKTYKLL